MKPADEANSRTPPPDETDGGTEAPRDPGRREALAKLGKLAAWTAPVIVTLTLSERASADSPTTPPDAPLWPPTTPTPTPG